MNLFLNWSFKMIIKILNSQTFQIIASLGLFQIFLNYILSKRLENIKALIEIKKDYNQFRKEAFIKLKSYYYDFFIFKTPYEFDKIEFLESIALLHKTIYKNLKNFLKNYSAYLKENELNLLENSLTTIGKCEFEINDCNNISEPTLNYVESFYKNYSEALTLLKKQLKKEKLL